MDLLLIALLVSLFLPVAAVIAGWLGFVAFGVEGAMMGFISGLIWYVVAD